MGSALLPLAAACCWLLYRHQSALPVLGTALPPLIRRALLPRQAGGPTCRPFPFFLVQAWVVAILALDGPARNSPTRTALNRNQANRCGSLGGLAQTRLATDLQPNRIREEIEDRDRMQSARTSQLALNCLTPAQAAPGHPAEHRYGQTLNNLLTPQPPHKCPKWPESDADCNCTQMIADLPSADVGISADTSGREGGALDALRMHASQLGSQLSIIRPGSARARPSPRLAEGGFMA